MKKPLQIVKELSSPGMCCGRKNCPGVWELANGDIAIIGKFVSNRALKGNALGVSAARDERMVIVPRAVVKSAKRSLARL